MVAQYRSQHYQVCRRLWFADYYDPATFLSLFKDGLDRTNNSYWENHEYKEIVEQIEHFSAMDDRARVAQLIERAERIILQGTLVLLRSCRSNGCMQLHLSFRCFTRRKSIT